MKKYGYLELVSSRDFINGEQLAKEIGLEEGEPQHSNCDWMHFMLDGQELLVPTKTLRHSISWESIYKKGAVYSDTEGFGPNPGGSGVNQNQYVTVNGDRYKVTLLKGVNNENIKFDSDIFYDPELTWNSEWNRLMYRVHDGVHNPTHSNPTNTSHPYGVWDQLSDGQLQLDWLKNGCGTSSWCQEKGGWNRNSHDLRVNRGHRGVSFVSCLLVTNSDSALGWRPALRKM